MVTGHAVTKAQQTKQMVSGIELSKSVSKSVKKCQKGDVYDFMLLSARGCNFQRKA